MQISSSRPHQSGCGVLIGNIALPSQNNYEKYINKRNIIMKAHNQYRESR